MAAIGPQDIVLFEVKAPCIKFTEQETECGHAVRIIGSNYQSIDIPYLSRPQIKSFLQNISTDVIRDLNPPLHF